MLPRRRQNLLSLHRTLVVSAVIWVFPVYGHAQAVPLSQILAEANSFIQSGANGNAGDLLLRALERIDAGEAPPAGISLEGLRLAAARTEFLVGNYARSEEIASRLLATNPSPTAASQGRIILGLSLARQRKFAPAIPVFSALADDTKFNRLALSYLAAAAQEADQLQIAIAAYNRLLSSGPRDSEWADSALTLISLHLRQKNLAEARRGLNLLRSDFGLVDNVAGLNILSLQLGDALLQNGDAAGAIAAYRTVTPREELTRLQTQRALGMQAAIVRARALASGNLAEADVSQRIETRLAKAKASLDAINQIPDYDANLLYRLGSAFEQDGAAWEAALVYQRLIEHFPASADVDQARLGLVHAYADAGRLDRMKISADAFLTASPKSEYCARAFYVAAQAAGNQHDIPLQLHFIDAALLHFSTSALHESLQLMQANAFFALGRWEEARSSAEAYLREFPDGAFAEDACYLHATAGLMSGQAERALSEIAAYQKKFPQGRFLPDSRYRAAALEFALENYPLAATQIDAWLADYPQEALRGEVLSLRGDVASAQGQPDEAIASYRRALAVPLGDDQLGYVLDELTKLYQSRRDFDSAAALWEDFVRDHPDHPFIVNAAYWIGRIRSQQGRNDEAVARMAAISRRYLAEPDRDTIEQLLVQIAQVLSRPPRPGADGLRPAPPSDDEIAARLSDLLLPDQSDNATARARLLFTRAEVASLRRNDGLRDRLYDRLCNEFAPAALPPGILGRIGDYAREHGNLERAREFAQYLISHYAHSVFADFGYAGLGEIAFAAGDYDQALTRFSDAIDRAGARFKLREATLGRAKSLLALGRLDAARELFEQIASNRQWRGPATAESVFSLGEILARQGGPENLAQAQAFFQRVYISYRKYPDWVARAYLRSGEIFEQLGSAHEALATYRELLRDQRFASFPETETARQRAADLEASGV